MEELLEHLDSSHSNESDLQVRLRTSASQILTSSQPSTTTTTTSTSTITSTNIPTTTLLTETIKPLFSKSHHNAITSTGRKNLISSPSLPTRFTNTATETDSIFGPPPPWKNPWTLPLLLQILDSYPSTARKVLEDDFYLLVPALLILLDDADIAFKVAGCTCVTRLCDALREARSDILKRSGLAEVFLDALRGCFHYLPSLTPENESLQLLEGVYLAWMGVVKARFWRVEDFIGRDGGDVEGKGEITTIVPLNTQKQSQRQKSATGDSSTNQLTPPQISAELVARTTHLSTLLRHSLLHTISHLRSSPDAGTTTSVPITAFLLTQIAPILREMHIDAAVHVKALVPILVNTLRDPFATSALGMMGAAVDAVEAVVVCCWYRVKERWWVEMLRGLMEAWLNCRDELGDRKVDGEGEGEGLRGVMGKVERVVKILRDVVGMEFEGVVERLVEEEKDLRGLFMDEEEENSR